ncbi:DUF300-domain-containing protein [Pseudovirgaria hyperparasitica]|uniref:DUF300-domain-containing protein n=1 Tax=Pseudovirgaria hyperparasitica TaxID=470096 RepID=A0A6A6W117_9PEZI|nr:DUF300-domain-containing protein [Pseudovirgaria hyperparasitica]KAF2755786.1 DUF300-domain-containing protein [Pseudovirgaria hyperparasitica]
MSSSAEPQLTDLLSVRHLFHGDDDSHKHICPQELSVPTIPITGSLTFHTLASLISAGAAVFVLVLSVILVSNHARHYAAPREQRQVIRIICIVPFFSVVALLVILAGENGQYVEPARSVGEAVAIASFFLLCAEYVVLVTEGAKRMVRSGRAPWLKKVWYMVLQFLPVSVLLWIFTAATFATGTYCKQSNKLYFAHIWLTVITFVTTFAALLAVIKFYHIMKVELKPQRALLQLCAFKGLVALSVLQSFIINILLSTNTIKPSEHMSYADINEALPSLLISCEMPFFAVFFFYAFGAGRYKAKVTKLESRACFRAIIDAANVSDIFSAFVRGPVGLLREHGQKSRHTQSGEYVGLVASPPHSDTVPIVTRPLRPVSPSPERYEGRV